MKKLFRKIKKKLPGPLVLIPIVFVALILVGGYFLFFAGDDDDDSKKAASSTPPATSTGPGRTTTIPKPKTTTVDPGPDVGKEFTIDSDRDEKDYATVQATGAITSPARISVRVGAAPKQPVTVNSSITCLLATEGARTNVDTFSVTPPATRELKLPVKVEDAISCTATANAQLTRAGKGRIKVFLVGAFGAPAASDRGLGCGAMGALEQAVSTVVERCLQVSAGETVLVIADPDRAQLGQALLEGSRATGGDAVLTILPPNPARGTEPPAPVAAALAACDVFIAPLPAVAVTHDRAQARERRGARGATMPGVTEDLLARLMSVDFDAMSERCHAVAKLLDESDEAVLTCPRGTDLRLDLRGRLGIPDDGDLSAAGAFGNLPCGEGFIAPAGGQGTIAASSLPGPGVVDEPVVLEVRDGRLDSADDSAAAAQYLEQLDAHGPLGRNLAELGVGTNDRATLTGNILEDEKMLGTAHVAFGASAAIGGTVTVPVHLDVLVLEPSLRIGATQVLDGGRYVLA